MVIKFRFLDRCSLSLVSKFHIGLYRGLSDYMAAEDFVLIGGAFAALELPRSFGFAVILPRRALY